MMKAIIIIHCHNFIQFKIQADGETALKVAQSSCADVLEILAGRTK